MFCVALRVTCVDEVGNQIGPAGALDISSGLRENSTLLYLDMRGIYFSFFSLTFSLGLFLLFVLLMKYFCSVRKDCNLDVDEIVGAIDSEGTLHISDMLRENSTLLYLEIGGEYFSFPLSYFLSPGLF